MPLRGDSRGLRRALRGSEEGGRRADADGRHLPRPAEPADGDAGAGEGVGTRSGERGNRHGPRPRLPGAGRHGEGRGTSPQGDRQETGLRGGAEQPRHRPRGTQGVERGDPRVRGGRRERDVHDPGAGVFQPRGGVSRSRGIRRTPKGRTGGRCGRTSSTLPPMSRFPPSSAGRGSGRTRRPSSPGAWRSFPTTPRAGWNWVSPTSGSRGRRRR